MLAQLRTRLLARWGRKLAAAALSAAAPQPELEIGAKALVEVSLPLGRALVEHPPAVASGRTPHGQEVRLHLIGRAPRSAASIGGQSLFYLMTTKPLAPIGTPLTVGLSATAREAGVLAPRSAVVWYRGEPLVFREARQGSFVPVPIRSSFISRGGYFVPLRMRTPLQPDDRSSPAGRRCFTPPPRNRLWWPTPGMGATQTMAMATEARR